MAKKIYDIDALAREYEPVVIRFRGGEYTLGDTTEGVLKAVKAAQALPDTAPLDEQLKLLPAVLTALSKPLGATVGDASDLSLGERLALQRAVTELMTRVGNVPFRPSE